MKIFSLNCAHTSGNWTAIAKFFRDESPDIAMLQEGIGIGPFDSIKMLANIIGGYHVEACAMHYADPAGLINWRLGIVSKQPIRDVVQWEFGILDEDKWRRSALMAWIGDWRVVSIHYGFEQKGKQIQETLEMFTKYFPDTKYDVIAGDFNFDLDGRTQLTGMLTEAGFVDVWTIAGQGYDKTFPGNNIRCDGIFVRGPWEPSKVIHVDGLSDHQGVLAV